VRREKKLFSTAEKDVDYIGSKPREGSRPVQDVYRCQRSGVVIDSLNHLEEFAQLVWQLVRRPGFNLRKVQQPYLGPSLGKKVEDYSANLPPVTARYELVTTRCHTHWGNTV